MHLGQRLAWVGIALLAVYLVFIGGGWLGIYTSGLRILTVSLTGGLILVWALVAWRRPAWRPRSVLLPAMVACLASMTISTAFSRVPRMSFEYLGYAILLGALYLLLVRLMAQPFFRERLISLAVLLFVGISLEFIVAVIYLWVPWWGLLGHLAIPPLRPNFIGLSWGNPSAILTIVALFAVPTAARFASWERRGIAAFVAIGVTVGVVAVLTGSRAGWLALAIALAVGAIGLVATGGTSKVIGIVTGQSNGGNRLALAIRAAAVVVIVGGALVLVPGVLARAQSGGEGLRLDFYVTALRIFAASPIVGTGPGSWVIERPAFTTPNQTDYYIPHAHDVPLQTLAELGLVGAAAGVVLLASLGWLVVDAARSSVPARRRWGWIAGLGLVYLFAHDLLDFYPNMPAILLPAVLPVAYLDATTEERPTAFRRPLPDRLPDLAAAAGLLLAVIAVIGLIGKEGAALQNDRAVAAANAGNWPAAVGPAKAAAATDSDVDPFDLTAGLAAAHAGDHAAAAAYFEHVATRDDLPEAWLNLAAEQVELGRTEPAVASLQRALRIGFQRVEISLPAGDLALRLGNSDLATTGFASALVEAPTLAGDPWWQADPARKGIYPAVLDAAIVNAGRDNSWQLALMANDAAQARALAASSSNPPGNAVLIDAWEGSAAALDQQVAACNGHPLDLIPILWCGLLEEHAGNKEAAQRFRDEAETLNAGSSANAMLTRVSSGQTSGSSPEAAYYWAVFTYRVWAPYDLLVPTLVHLQYE